MKTYCLPISTLLLLLFAPIFAQKNIAPGVSESDWDAIQAQITSSLNTNYRITDVVNVDSAIGNRFVADGAISNPFGKLTNCYIFTAIEEIQDDTSESHGAIGVYKNGNILWQSGPVINASFSMASAITLTRDLNDDGNVEIISSWFEGAQGGIERFWIFSWDGQAGSLITAVDDKNESMLISTTSGFEFVDVNGDNIFEITGDWYANESDEVMTKITYSWNGSQYGKWANSPQPLPSGFYPRHKIEPTIRSIIKNAGGKFSYNYLLQSSPSSKQMINAFILIVLPDSVANGAGPEDWDFGGVPAKAVGWLASPGFDAFIRPGFGASSFYFESNRAPAIVQSLVRGDNGNWSSILGDTVEYSIDQWLDEALSNSFKATTIGPGNLSNPFIPLNFLDTLSSYTTQSRSLGWITNQPTADKYLGYFSTAKQQLQSNNTNGARQTLQTVVTSTISDSLPAAGGQASNLTSEAYALLRFNTEYLISQLPQQASGLPVKLVSSSGANLTTGTLQYYEGSWKDAVNNGDGTFTVATTKPTTSLRMTYEYGAQQKNNVTVGSTPVIFQTINAQVKLQNSQGNPLDTGTVQYYAGAWRTFGTTTSGTASKELLANNYSFRMTYAYGSNDKQQDLNANSIVVFQTVNAAVQLKNSQGNLIDQGTVQYYSGAWRAFGSTTNGVVTKELLPNNYSFRMTYAYGSNDKQQNLSTNPTVVFQTVNAVVQLKNSQGNLIVQGTVQYYSGAWRTFGTTMNGVATKELLPNNYSFRMSYAYASNDKAQNLSSDPTVVFQTVNAAVQLKNSQGIFIDQGTVQYYSGAWRSFGTTANGTASKELLPKSYQFRMTHGYISNDKTQDIGANNAVAFSTVAATVRVTNLQNNPVNNAAVTYYSGAWRTFGTTAANGEAIKELLPANLQFRAKLGSVQQDKTQNLSANPVVEIQLNINQ